MKMSKNSRKKYKNLEKFNIRRIISFIFISSMFLFFIKIAFSDILLKNKGICVKSILTKETTKVRGLPSTLVYNFWVNGKVYDGNSNIEDLSKAGDSICVVYLDWMPSINAPLSFFDKSINCNCK